MAEQTDNGSTVRCKSSSNSGIVGIRVQQFSKQTKSTTVGNGYPTTTKFEGESISVVQETTSVLTCGASASGPASSNMDSHMQMSHVMSNHSPWPRINPAKELDLSDVGIIKMEIPDSVATIDHLNDKDGPYKNGVSNEVHNDIIKAIRNDTTQYSDGINYMQSLQWTLCAPLKPNRSKPPLKQKKMSALSSSRSSQAAAVTSSPPDKTSDSDTDPTPEEDLCFSWTVPAVIPSQDDPPPTDDPVIQRHIKKKITPPGPPGTPDTPDKTGGIETVLVQVWFTANHIHDASDKPYILRMIRQCIAKNIANILFGTKEKYPELREKYRVFVVMNEIFDDLF